MTFKEAIEKTEDIAGNPFEETLKEISDQVKKTQNQNFLVLCFFYSYFNIT